MIVCVLPRSFLLCNAYFYNVKSIKLGGNEKEKDESYQNIIRQNEKQEQKYKNHVRQLEKQHTTELKKGNNITNQLQQTIEKLKSRIPKITDYLSIEKEAKSVGFSDEWIKKLIQGKSIEFSGKLWSEEYRRHFETDHSIAKIEETLDERKKTKLYLTIDRLTITEWCRKRFKELNTFKERRIKL